jgi:hypothetical protein
VRCKLELHGGARVAVTTLLYWLVYNFDLGPVGPWVLDKAVRSWIEREKERRAARAIFTFRLWAPERDFNLGK